MKKEVLISIVVPIYNVERYLRQCLDSIINQTYKNIEIILVNDKSPDKSIEIIREYEKKDSRIVVIDCKENGGYGRVVNKGIEIASGDWIGIVDSDDFISLDMYKTLVSYIKKTDSSIIRGNYYFYYDKKGFRQNVAKKDTRNNYIFGKIKEEGGKEFDISYLNKDSDIYFFTTFIWTSIYKKDFIKQEFMKIIENKGASYQDVEFFLKSLFFSDKIYLVNKHLYYYRQTSIDSAKHSKEKVLDIFKVYNHLKGNLIKYDKEKLEEFKYIFYEAFMNYYKTHFLRVSNKYRKLFMEQWKKEVMQMITSEDGLYKLIIAFENEDNIKNLQVIYNNNIENCLKYFRNQFILKKFNKVIGK